MDNTKMVDNISVGAGYWEKISAYINEIPHLANIVNMSYDQAKKSPTFDFKEFSEEAKQFAFEHAQFLLEMSKSTLPQEQRLIGMLNIDISKLERFVLNDKQRKERREENGYIGEEVGQFIPILESATNQAFDEKTFVKMSLLDPQRYQRTLQSMVRNITNARGSFYENGAGKAVTHMLLVVFGAMDLASDVLPDGDELVERIKNQSVDGLESAIGLGVIRGLVELLAVNQLSSAYRAIKEGKMRKGLSNLATGLTLSVVSISSFLTTKSFVFKTQPDFWLEATGPFLFNASAVLIALLINYAGEVNLLMHNISEIDNSTEDEE